MRKNVHDKSTVNVLWTRKTNWATFFALKILSTYPSSHIVIWPIFSPVLGAKTAVFNEYVFNCSHLVEHCLSGGASGRKPSFSIKPSQSV